jgi:uncharacterized protein (DUF58 family)
MIGIYSKIREYEIRLRKAVTTQMQGNFQSVFKGSGLEFDDIRPYQYGDDIRHIDWNSSAKGHGTFIKTFKEDREQNVFFILDVSASQDLGKPQKIETAREVCSVLALSAIKEGSTVGLICYSDLKERYLKPGKGLAFGYAMVKDIYKLKPRSKQTNLTAALLAAQNLVKRKSVVVMISDFIDQDYQKALKGLATRHDLIAIHLTDRRERTFPALGIVPLIDKESQKTLWVNSSSAEFRKKVSGQQSQIQSELQQLCRKTNSSYLALQTGEDFVPALVKLFRIRNSARM